MAKLSRNAPQPVWAWLKLFAASGALATGACANIQGRPYSSVDEFAAVSAGGTTLSPALALEATQLALSTCSRAGFATTVVVADLEGEPMAVLSANGANPRTHQIAPTKIAIARKYGVPSSAIAEKVKEDAALAAEIADDPTIGTARGGALPLIMHGHTVGYIAVSGAPSGEQDEMCALRASQLVAAHG